MVLTVLDVFISGLLGTGTRNKSAQVQGCEPAFCRRAILEAHRPSGYPTGHYPESLATNLGGG